MGRPSAENPFLFNGDFVDRGVWSVEVLMCIYAFKLQNPGHVHLNRGNHETEMTNYQYGFANEVEVKYEKAHAVVQRDIPLPASGNRPGRPGFRVACWLAWPRGASLGGVVPESAR